MCKTALAINITLCYNFHILKKVIEMNKENTVHIFKSIPALNTERLILRKILPSDYKDMYEYSSSEDVTRYLAWNKHPCIEYTKQYADYLQSRYKIGDFYDWAIELKETGKMIGTCGFTRFDYANNSAEIGYVLNSRFWGNGYCVEAINRIIEFGFDVLSLNRIEARYIKGNSQSARVMEKCKMKSEGILRGAAYIKSKYCDIGVCSILKEDFENTVER